MKNLLITAAAVAALASTPAQAVLTLTSAAIADGFTLSTFVDQLPSTGFCCGPLGVATNSFGQVVLNDYARGRNYVFTDVDGQHFADALSSAPYASNSYGPAFTNSGGNLYATNNDAGAIVYRLNPDGSINSPLTAAGIGGHGIWTNPATGHLVAATGNGLRDIDPATGASTVIVTGFDIDGVSVSADGKTVYGATGGRVLGWSYAGALVYDSGNIGSPDGTGVIQGTSLFAGNIVANNNDGRVFLLDPVAHTSRVIATGGSRGDYVGVDSTNGSLFLTQTDSVLRLGCGEACFFTPLPAVPEPGTYALMLAGLAGLGFALRRRRPITEH